MSWTLSIKLHASQGNNLKPIDSLRSDLEKLAVYLVTLVGAELQTSFPVP